jgi:hypothetical protein
MNNRFPEISWLKIPMEALIEEFAVNLNAVDNLGDATVCPVYEL